MIDLDREISTLSYMKTKYVRDLQVGDRPTRDQFGNGVGSGFYTIASIDPYGDSNHSLIITFEEQKNVPYVFDKLTKLTILHP